MASVFRREMGRKDPEGGDFSSGGRLRVGSSEKPPTGGNFFRRMLVSCSERGTWRRLCFGLVVGLGVPLLLMFLLLPSAPLGVLEAGAPSGMIPYDEIPSEPMDRGDSVLLAHGVSSWKRHSQAVLVLGVESSGSKLAARSVARRIVYPGESKPVGWDRDWDGHGAIGNESLGTFVLHRSLPHNDKFPHIETICSQLHFFGFNVVIVIATRDREISYRSRLSTHQPDAGIARREHWAAIRALQDTVKQTKYPVLIYSYETHILLGNVYLDSLFRSTIQNPIPNNPRPYIAPAILDGNAKYVRQESGIEAVFRYILWFWAPRRSTVGNR